MNLKKQENGCDIIHTQLKFDSPFVKNTRSLLYVGLVVLPMVIIGWFWGYLNIGKSTLYIFYSFVIIVAFLYIKRDALLIMYFLLICYIIFFIECLITPYIVFPKLITQIFISQQYWLLFSLGYFAIILRHIFFIKQKMVRKNFQYVQKYLQQGIFYIPPSYKLEKITCYEKRWRRRIFQISFDAVAMSEVIFVMIKGASSIYGRVPLMDFKTYLGACASVLIAIIFARFFIVGIYRMYSLLTAKKAKHTRFVFASDDA
jgi:hypothetical protein